MWKPFKKDDEKYSAYQTWITQGHFHYLKWEVIAMFKPEQQSSVRTMLKLNRRLGTLHGNRFDSGKDTKIYNLHDIFYIARFIEYGDGG